jgi:probable F420-dependent oxidoreductase
MRAALSVIGLEAWFGGDFAAVVELVQTADRVGIDQVLAIDHVVMGESLDRYPYGRFQGRSDYPFLDPMVQLGTYASVTKTVKLATGIVIAPLRPAPVLAKQIATLDVLSCGRAEIGLGTGWQKEEYDACGVAWERRFDYMEEQVRAMRQLWTEAPTSFHGRSITFDRLYALPFPTQGPQIPLHFGVAATERNIARIAELGNGWLPMEQNPQKLIEPVLKLKAAFVSRGRKAEDLEVRTTLATVKGANGKPDLDASLAAIPEYVAAGVTTLRFAPPIFCRGPDDYIPFLEKIIRAVKG